MTDANDWKPEARSALRAYPKAKQKGDRAIVGAVERALKAQRRYYNAEARLRMIDMVYFRRTHTLYGAAVAVEYSIETIKKWNLELLSAVYTALQYEYEKGPGG